MMEDQLTTMFRVEHLHGDCETTIKIFELPVVKQTGLTAWIKDKDGKIRRVTKDPDAKQAYAFVDKPKAMKAFLHKKLRYLRIIKHTQKVFSAIAKSAQIMIEENSFVDEVSYSHWDLKD